MRRLDRPLQLRFTVNCQDETTQTVEAGVDELSILSETPSCLPPTTDGGIPVAAMPESGCALGGSARPAGPSLVLALLCLLPLLRRRR